MTTLPDLVAELEAADAQFEDEELNARIWATTNGYTVQDDTERDLVIARYAEPPHNEFVLGRIDPGKRLRNFVPNPHTHVPAYTTSIDAAVALCEQLLPGWSWTVSVSTFRNEAYGNVFNPGVMGRDAVTGETTPALALTIAALKAHEAQQ